MKTKDMCLIALMAALICVAGPMTAPIGMVPLSLATFAVYLSGAVLGAKRGTLAVAVYILVGLVTAFPYFAGFRWRSKGGRGNGRLYNRLFALRADHGPGGMRRCLPEVEAAVVHGRWHCSPICCRYGLVHDSVRFHAGGGAAACDPLPAGRRNKDHRCERVGLAHS